MKLPTLEEMIEAGVHFGHKKQRSYPKAKKYIFGLREGINIIDLEKTVESLEVALEYIKKNAKAGKTILFVGTKSQAKSIVEEAAKKVGMPYVTERWLGGTLTNYETIRKSIKHLEDLEKNKKSEEYEKLTKKEKLDIEEEIIKLHKIFDGILNLKGMPDIMFVADAAEDYNAVNEAIVKEIPIVAVCDTNANPDKIDYPIPANDDAVKSIEMIVNLVRDAVAEGKEGK